jgi:hypothetical protein
MSLHHHATLDEAVRVIAERFTGPSKPLRSVQGQLTSATDAAFAGSRHVKFVDIGLIDELLVILFDSPAARNARFAYIEALDGILREFPDDPEDIAALVITHLEEVVAGSRWFDSPRIVRLGVYGLIWPIWQSDR